MRYTFALAIVSALAATGCGGGDRAVVPDVAGERLDVAVEELEDEGLAYEVIGGGAFGVVVKSNWRVCSQEPAGGATARSVELVVARSCFPPPPPPEPVVPDVLYDDLDDAKEELARAGIEPVVVNEGTGAIVVESNWTVCDQYPLPGEYAEAVELYVEHICED